MLLGILIGVLIMLLVVCLIEPAYAEIKRDEAYIRVMLDLPQPVFSVKDGEGTSVEVVGTYSKNGWSYDVR